MPKFECSKFEFFGFVPTLLNSKQEFTYIPKKNLDIFQDDIGVSGVIGSAVFNITLVIAVCALAAEQALYLNWYSVVRDCTCYLICILVLLITISNSIVSW